MGDLRHTGGVYRVRSRGGVGAPRAGTRAGGVGGRDRGQRPGGSRPLLQRRPGLATARAFATVSDLPLAPRTMALLSQRAENEWVG